MRQNFRLAIAACVSAGAIVIGVLPASTAASQPVVRESAASQQTVGQPAIREPVARAVAARFTPPKPCLKYPGKVICASKASKRVFAIEDGRNRGSARARFGGIASDGTGPWYTREGVFSTFSKNPNAYSTLYHVYMPWYQGFSGGQGFHYSYEFAGSGYSYSHGCIGMRSWTFTSWLYDWAPLGTRVVVTRR